MSIFAANTSTAWAQFHDQIAQRLGGALQNGVVVQPLGISPAVDWDTNQKQLNLYYQQALANAIPTWTPLYQVAAGRNLPDEYRSFIDQLTTKLVGQANGLDQTKINDILTQTSAVQTAYNKFEGDTKQAYLKYRLETPENERVSKSEWEVRNGYAGQREGYQRQLQYLQGAYIAEVSNAGPDLLELGRAAAALGDQARQMMKLPMNEDEILLGEEIWQYFYKTYIGGDIFRFKNETKGETMTMTQGRSETTTFQSSWEARGGASWFGLFSASGSREENNITKSWESNSTSVTMHFSNLATFNILRGSWFQGGLINKYLDKLPREFWGSGGRLNLIPTSVVLGRGLKIDVATSSEVGEYIYNRRDTRAGGGFSIGPFSFGARGGGTTTYERTSVVKTSNGFSVEDTSGRAIVLAVVSNRPLDLFSGNDPHPLGFKPEVLFPTEDRIAKVLSLRDEHLVTFGDAGGIPGGGGSR